MINFNFNGQNSDNFDIIVLEVRRQLFPGTNDVYMEIPGKQGTILYPRELKDAILEIDCAILSNDIQNIRQMARNIMAWLYTEQRAKLYFSDEPDKYYMGKFSNESELENLIAFETMGKFTLVFRCEPLAYGEQQIIDFINNTANIVYDGTYKTKPSFYLNFVDSSSDIKISKGDEYIKIVHPFVALDKLNISSDGIILINDIREMDKLDWQHSNFFDILPGNNVIEITPENIAFAQVMFTPSWL